MKIMLKIWILFGVLATVVVSQSSYEPDHLIQDSYYDSEERPYHPSIRRHQRLRSYEPASHEEGERPRDPRHYQSLEPGYQKQEPESYHRSPPQYHAVPQQVQYQQPEDPSYHRPQEIVYHHQQQQPESYQEAAPQHQQPYDEPVHHVHQPDEKEDPKYGTEEPKYVPPLRPPPRATHPAPVPSDPKLPLYFTMYEKRVVQDPVHKYGKGPWRYLTYGHGITYGSKEPGKVFEKGYGYIRALGRDHCKLPEHLCPPRDEKPFDYEGRKEPYFGYRPH